LKGVDEPRARTPLLKLIQIHAGKYWQYPQ
jgi:hypothetical protein